MPEQVFAEKTDQQRRRDAKTVRRFRLATGCLLLTALAFLQAPGRVVGDTKLDLVVDPGGLLQRAMTMWDPDGFLGQVQNQAYGYLFPMGPFFWIGDLLSLEPWVVQRLWWALLWCVAFVGAARLCRALGVGTPGLHLVAGILYALSPRVLTIMGVNSIEAWPASVAPWVLVPLVLGIRSGRPRLRAAQSAVAVACVGGVNAVATAAVLPLATLWLLMAPKGRRRRTMLLWWPPLVLAVTAWWWVPLVLLGQYSPPFLDYIESSTNTTMAASVFDALRGTTNWVPRVSPGYVAGRDLLTWPVLVVALTLVAAAGVGGLARRDLPFRRLLLAGVLAGVVLTTLGHTGDVSGIGGERLQDLLDGPLAAMRNTHKFDVVVRLPLVVAAVHLISVLLEHARAREHGGEADARWWRRATVLVSGTVVVAAVTPVLAARVAPAADFDDVPRYWQEAAAWLGDQPDSTTLVVPANRFGDYLWGSTGDDVMQPLAEASWVARPVVPLTPAGTVGLLDSVSDELAQGMSSEGLAVTLRRAGIDHVVVRFDLSNGVDPDRAEVAWQTLAASPGITPAAHFGPVIGGPSYETDDEDRQFVDGGRRTSHPAVVVFRVLPPESTADVPAERTPLTDVPVVLGGASTVAALDRLGLLGAGPVLLAADRVDGATGPVIVTDGLRHRETDFSRVELDQSAALTDDDPYGIARRVHDRTSEADLVSTSRTRLVGAASLEASSSTGWAGGTGPLRPSGLPWAAFDGESRTAWVADESTGWIRLGLDEPTDLGNVVISAGLPPGVAQEIVVHTATGAVSRTLVGAEAVHVAVGVVEHLRIDVTSSSGPARLAEVTSEALSLTRPVTLPAASRPDQIVLGLDQGVRPFCVTVLDVDQCRAGSGDEGEDAYTMDREVRLLAQGTFDVAVTTRAVAGDSLDAVLQSGSVAQLRSSSTVAPDPRASTTRAVDGDASTGWIAHPDDTRPTLTLTYPSSQAVSGLSVVTDASLPASSVRRVWVRSDSGATRVALVGSDQTATFAPLTGSTFRITLDPTDDATDLDSAGWSVPLPVGVSELTVLGAPSPGPGPAAVAAAGECGTGPTIETDAGQIRTALDGTVEDLLQARPVPARVCDGLDELALSPGANRIVVTASTLAEAGTVVLDRTSPTAAEPTGSSLVTTDHNANPGWTATVDGTPVEPIAVEGWRQAWIVPDDLSGAVETSFAPGPLYRGALLGGGVLAVLALVATLLAGLSARRRRDAVGDRDAAEPSLWSSDGALLTAGAVTLLVTSGPAGLVAGLVSVGVVAAIARRSRHAWVLGAAVLAAGGLVAVSAATAPSLTPEVAQWAGVVALALLVAALVTDGGRSGSRGSRGTGRPPRSRAD